MSVFRTLDRNHTFTIPGSSPITITNDGVLVSDSLDAAIIAAATNNGVVLIEGGSVGSQLTSTDLTYITRSDMQSYVDTHTSGSSGNQTILTPSGDVTGATDATAINTAINAVSNAGGGYVLLGIGNWYVSASLTPKSNIVLSGYGPGTIIKHTGNSNIIYANTVGFTDFSVENITFVGTVNEFPTSPQRSRTTSGVGTQTAIFMTGDLDTSGTGQAQLTNFIMRNCTVKNCSALPIRIGGVRGTVKVIDCEFINNQDIGFLFNQEVIFSNNHVVMSADNGVSLSRGNTKITCTGNTFENCCYNGIWVAGFLTDLGPTNVSVVGNVIKNVGFNGIYLDYAPQHVVVSSNEIDCGYFRGPSDQATNINGAGIYVGGYPTTNRPVPTNWATGIVLVANHIRTAARCGIYMTGVKHVVVTSNIIADIGTQFLADGTTAIASSDSTQNIGIYLDNATTSTDVSVTMNTITDTRITPYTNFGLVPQSASQIAGALNQMSGCRNAFNLLEGGPQRTINNTWLFNFAVKNIGGATAGAGSATGTVTGYDVNGAAGSVRPFRLLTGGNNRWHLRANGSAESGSNVGSDLEIAAYDDNAAALTTPLILTRRGAVTIGVSGQPITLSAKLVSAASSVSLATGPQSTSITAGSNGANDIVGTVNTVAISSPVAGTIAIITFGTAFTVIPHVIITPTTSTTGLYVSARSTTSFSVATTVTPASGATISFDYLVVG